LSKNAQHDKLIGDIHKKVNEMGSIFNKLGQVAIAFNVRALRLAGELLLAGKG